MLGEDFFVAVAVFAPSTSSGVSRTSWTRRASPGGGGLQRRVLPAAGFAGGGLDRRRGPLGRLLGVLDGLAPAVALADLQVALPPSILVITRSELHERQVPRFLGVVLDVELLLHVHDDVRVQRFPCRRHCRTCCRFCRSPSSPFGRSNPGHLDAELRLDLGVELLEGLGVQLLALDLVASTGASGSGSSSPRGARGAWRRCGGDADPHLGAAPGSASVPRWTWASARPARRWGPACGRRTRGS